MHPRTVWLLKAVGTAGLLGWLFSRPGVREGLGSLGQLTPGWLVAGFLTAGLAQALAAWRWHVCLRTSGAPLPPGTVFRLTLMSNAAGLLSIGTLGADAVRVALAARRRPGRKASLLGSLALDHFSATPAYVAVGLLVLSTAGVSFQAGPATGGILLGGAILFVLTGLVLRRWYPALHDRLLGFLMKRNTRSGFVQAALLSVPLMICHYGVFYCAARALGVVVPPLPFAAAAATADTVASLPITIAGLGVREKAFETLLGLWHQVPPAAAITLSLAGLGLILLWGLAGALLFLTEPAHLPGTPLSPDPRPVP